MSRWWLLAVPLLLAVALGAFVAWLGGPVEPTASLPAPLEAAAEPEPPTPHPSAAPAATALPGARARLSGRVLHDGAPAAGAEVVVKGAEFSRGTTDAEGRFALEVDAPMELWLSARQGTLSSATVGPLAVAPGQRHEGLELHLLPGASVEGTVVDAHSRAPIAGAQLVTSAGTIRSAADGSFRVDGLSVGRNWLSAQAPGFLPRTEWLQLEGARPHKNLEIALVRAAHIEGRVTRAGTPAAGIAVWAERTPPDATERHVPGMSDAQGRYALEVGPGTLQLSAAAPGRGRVAGPVVSLAPGQSASVDFELGEALDAAGTVALDGQPLAGAALTAHDAQSQALIATATSGPDGAFRFGGLSVGRYVLSVRAAQGVWEAGPYEQAGDGAPWAVSLQSGGVLEGRVEPPSAGVRVTWRPRSTLGAGANTATEASGAFRFAGVPNAPVLVEAVGPTGSAAATARPGEQVVLRLGPGALRVAVFSGSRPVTDFRLRAREVQSGAVRQADVLSPAGTFRLEVPPGTWELWVSARGFAHEGAPARAVVQGGEVDVGIDLKPGRRVMGTVKDRATGAPLAGAVVRSSRRYYGLFDSDDGPSTATDAAGRYTISPVLPWAALVFERAGYQRFEVAGWQVMRANPDALEVALAPSGGKPDAPRAEPYEGVGMQLAEQPGRIIVQSVFPQGPAEAAGVRSGDQILAVNGSPAAPPIDGVVARVRGPAGSVVRLDLLRGTERVEAWPRRASIRP